MAELTCILQLLHRWVRHHQLSVAAWLRWQVKVCVCRIVARNGRHPYQKLAAKVDPNDKKSVDIFCGQISPGFLAAKEAANRRDGPPITDDDRERCLARHLLLPGGRMCDWTAPGTPVSQPEHSAIGGEGRRNLEPTTSGETNKGVDWEDRYPLAGNGGYKINDRNGSTREVYPAVRMCTGRRMVMHELARFLQFIYTLTCISSHAHV